MALPRRIVQLLLQHHHAHTDAVSGSILLTGIAKEGLLGCVRSHAWGTTFRAGLSTASAASTSGRQAAAKGPMRGLKALLHDYKLLSKFKLSALVVLTSAGGFVAGSGESIDWAGLGWTALGTFGASACANTLNQLYEVSNDSRMTRTCNRPLPAGRLTRMHAAGFALTMGVMGLGVLHEKVRRAHGGGAITCGVCTIHAAGPQYRYAKFQRILILSCFTLQTNLLTTCLGASNIALYAGIYTPLKQLSVANTWVGALVGAIPPLMGWAAAAGSLEPGSAVLAIGLFSWQMPHFMALAWLCKDDYMRGGFKVGGRRVPYDGGGGARWGGFLLISVSGHTSAPAVLTCLHPPL